MIDFSFDVFNSNPAIALSEMLCNKLGFIIFGIFFAVDPGFGIITAKAGLVLFSVYSKNVLLRVKDFSTSGDESIDNSNGRFQKNSRGLVPAINSEIRAIFPKSIYFNSCVS